MVVPLRKKFTIDITPSCIQARDPKTNEVVDKTTYRWDQISKTSLLLSLLKKKKVCANNSIASAFCLPVPEKSAKQYNYVLFVEDSQIVTNKATHATDPLVVTISATAPKPGSLTGSDLSTAFAVSDTHKALFDHYLTQQLKAAGRGLTITEANPKLFSSAIKEAHRPNEPAVHIKAFRGSKDGYLYFLPNGILWGFKKPLLFLPKDQLVAVSYVNVLQRTFNMAIEVDVRYKQEDGSYQEEREELEFGMIDQEDFAGIDAYVKRHGLQDSSMAEQRKAKRLGINTVKGGDGEKVDVGDGGELKKAEAELEQNDEDEEDEEDEGTDGEDFDPGSEGDSEGSGPSSEEESDVEGAGQGDDDDDGEDDEEEEL